jgi:catechol 2,3-dioxygenase-like lactoylglutathione lyase family enzyme
MPSRIARIAHTVSNLAYLSSVPYCCELQGIYTRYKYTLNRKEVMAAEFKHIMLMVKSIPASLKFYSEGLGLPVKMSSPGWAELDANGTTIALHAAEANAETGSSPILSFHVEDIQSAIATLEQLGASLEGRVREPSFGKVAAIRTPDGHLVSLLQPIAKSVV